MLQTQQAGEFGDIKSWEDVQRMANEDPFRYTKWDAQQKQIDLVARETHQAKLRADQEFETRRKEWAEQQDAEFKKLNPEFANPETAEPARKRVMSYLTDVVGVAADSIPALWNGKESVDFRNAKVQRLILDASKYHYGKQKAADAVAQRPPPVMRPGNAAPARSGDANIQALTQKLDSSRSTMESVRLAAALRSAKRAATR
jgi:hypothetical protein